MIKLFHNIYEESYETFVDLIKFLLLQLSSFLSVYSIKSTSLERVLSLLSQGTLV